MLLFGSQLTWAVRLEGHGVSNGFGNICFGDFNYLQEVEVLFHYILASPL